jgi:gamma-glutamyltranspeptidase/glutathione hydrolase
MGSGQVIPGTGILLNNTMDDFSVATGVGNLYGAVGGAPNRLQPGKTPLSSMTPTIVVERAPDGTDRPVLAIGAPGGTRIITCIAQTLLSQWVDGSSLARAVSAPRVHQQWIPDELVIEQTSPAAAIPATMDESLRRRGHKVRRGEVHCRVMAASIREAVSDPRDFGSALLLR